MKIKPNTWFYRDGSNIKNIESITDFPEGCIGYIYRITNLDTNKFYIGKKILQHTTNPKMGKKERAKLLAETKGSGRRPYRKQVIKESNWQSYYGSSKQLSEDVKQLGETKFMREILCYCFSKKSLSYYEMKYQVVFKCIEKPEQCYNLSVAGKWFVSDLLV